MIGDLRKLPLISLLFFLTASVSAQEKLELSGYEVIQFADYLFNAGEFESSEYEYNRYLYYFPEGVSKDHAHLQILRSRYLLAKYQEVLLLASKIRTEGAARDFLFEKNFLQMLAWFDLYKEKPFRLRLDSIEEGLKEIDLMPDYPGKSGLENFRTDWNNRNIENKKSPFLAGMFSALIPGTGSFYAGRYREGTYSLILTLLFYGAAYDAFRNDSLTLSYLLSGMGLIFHGGSVYTAVNSTVKYNDALEENFFDELRKTYGIRFRLKF